MHFQKIIFSDSVPRADSKNIHKHLQDCNGADDIFFGTTKQEFLSKLNKNYTAYAVGKNIKKLFSKFAEPLNDEQNLAFATIAESRVLYGSKTAEKISDILFQQNYLDEESQMNFRLILQEALMNAIEHGNLELSSEHDKGNNEETWFDDYYNKVNSALKNTPAGEKLVSIFVISKDDHLELWVEDEGKGFDTTEIYKNIDAENPYGKGLSVAVALSQSVSFEKNGSRCQFCISTHHKQGGFKPPSLSDAKKHGHVLVVDDQQSNLSLISYILKNGGYRNVATANNGNKALEKIATQIPDLILMDVNMPNLNGFETIEKLKTNPETANIPTIFLSGITNNLETRTKAFKLGAVDFISKDTDKTEILARTNVHIMNSIMFKAMHDFSNRLVDNLESARKFQTNLMPSPAHIEKINKHLPIKIEAEYHPCDELAGDYWSVFETKTNLIGFTMVDFTGHGVSAALDTIRLHAIFHELEALWGSPEALTRSINHRLCKMLELGKFATFVYGVLNIDNGKVTLVCCGAPPVGLIASNFDIKLLDASGIPLGLVNDSGTKLNIHHFKLRQNETLFLYSDALVETLHKDKTLWMDNENAGLIKAWRRSSKQEGSLLHNTLRKFNKTANKPLKDDLTLLTIKYTGAC